MLLALRPSLGSLLPRLLAGVAFLALSLTLTVLPAHAAAPAPAGSTGYDISWPQCPSSFPAGGSFAIVGITNGLAFSANPCLRDEYAWASSRPYAAGLYINTGNPETASSNWAGRASFGPRTCTAANLADPSNVDCAYNYGWNAAADALSTATASVGTAARTVSWWLDVEIGNSWNGTAAANSSTVQGNIDYLRSQGTGTVGIYSTGDQWAQITGGYTVPSSPSTAAAPDWLAGASSVSQAVSLCDPANSFSGGPVGLVQYPDSGFDGNYVCGAPPAPSLDYVLQASPASQTVSSGAGTTYTATLTAQKGYNSSVNLSVSGLPSGATGSFNPSTVTPTSTGASSTLMVNTSRSTPAGKYPLTITGTGTDSATTTHSTSATLVVQDFSDKASPSSASTHPTGSVTFTATATSLSGYGGTVTWLISGLPRGGTASFSPPNVSLTTGSSATSTLRVTTSGSPRGTYILTITGTSGMLSHTTQVTLTVTKH